MPPSTRRHRPSVTAGMDDISYLTLPEVRDRLERNQRVLNTSLFSSTTSPTQSPSASLGTSPTSPILFQANQLPNTGMFHSPISHSAPNQNSLSPVGSPSGDPVREKLLSVRQRLLAREQELLAQQGLATMELNDSPGIGGSSIQAGPSSAAGRRVSEGNAAGRKIRGNRAMAMEAIEAGDDRLARNGLMLPMSETLALGRRDFDNATAQNLAALTLNPQMDTPGGKYPEDSPKALRRSPRDRNTSSQGNPSPASRRRTLPNANTGYQGEVGGTFDPMDEIARAQATARMRAFMSYKDAEGDDEDILDDTAWGMGTGEPEELEGEYDGDGDRFELSAQGREPHRHERGTGEEVDEFGEDDEDWAEGNDDYLDRVR